MGTKDATIDVGKVAISHHAINRYAERFGGDEETMRDQLSRAVLFGAQRGEDRIYLDGDAAFVLDRFGVIKTTLTRSMLLANMQVAFRGFFPSEPVNVDTHKSEIDLSELASIAEQHCSSCSQIALESDVAKVEIVNFETLVSRLKVNIKRLTTKCYWRLIEQKSPSSFSTKREPTVV